MTLCDGELTRRIRSLRAFALRHLEPGLLLEYDGRDESPVPLVREVLGPQLGLPPLLLPEAFGGRGGSAVDLCRYGEELARIDLGLAGSALGALRGCDPILRGGTPAQQQRWLGRVCSEGFLIAFAASEAEADGDPTSLSTSAEPVARGGRIVGYRLSGSKQWVTNGGISDAALVLARAPGGPSWFLVEHGLAGFFHEPPENKHGTRLGNMVELLLDDVVVPADHLVGEVEGKGFEHAAAFCTQARLAVASFALGAGREALVQAMRFAERRLGGASGAASWQGRLQKLVVMHAVRLEAARASVEECAQRIDAGSAGEGLGIDAAVAKLLASEAANDAAEGAMQLLGPRGYLHEFGVEKLRRDVRSTRLEEGSSEQLERAIGCDRLRRHREGSKSGYVDLALGLETLAERWPGCGAATAASTLRALAEMLEREAGAPESEWFCLRIGAVAARAEGAASLVRRAVAAAEGLLPEGEAGASPSPEALATMARIESREAAFATAGVALRWLLGHGGDLATDAPFLDALCRRALHGAPPGGLPAELQTLAETLPVVLRGGA